MVHTVAAVACPAPLRPAVRTDLFFGLGRGGETAWSRFVAREVTPRFPEGFTLLNAEGQWRGSGRPIREATRVLVIYHRAGAVPDARIEAIRALYKRRFRQASVLRADSAACIGF